MKCPYCKKELYKIQYMEWNCNNDDCPKYYGGLNQYYGKNQNEVIKNTLESVNTQYDKEIILRNFPELK